MRARVNQVAFSREKKRLDNLLKAVSQNAFVVAKNSAEDYVKLVKTGIAVKNPPSFAPTWTPLSEQWKAIKTGHRDEFWAETLGILKAVRIKIHSKTIKFIRLFAGISETDSPAAFERTIRNEYGFGLGPARPLFEPAKDVIAPMTSAGRRLKDRHKFVIALRLAIKKVYK